MFPSVCKTGIGVDGHVVLEVKVDGTAAPELRQWMDVMGGVLGQAEIATPGAVNRTGARFASASDGVALG